MAKYIKPTLDTKFHIDFGWWRNKAKNLTMDLQGHACPEAKEAYHRWDGPASFDWIDPDTGEVFNVDTLWYLVYTHCRTHTDFIDERTPLTTAIFRAFIANNNTPLTAVELHEKLQKKTPDVILKTISGQQIFKGIRPVR